MTEPGSSFQFGVDRQTGLATIHEFMTLEAEVDARCRSNGDGDAYGIVLVDIEGLRAVNANYGFDFGDQVLVEIARRLRAMFDELRPRCIARVGGDEFAVLVDGIEASRNLSQLARKIRLDAVGYPLLIGATRIRLRLRTTFRRGPSRKPVASDLLWEVQWADRIEATRELHQRLEALEQRDGQLAGQAADLRERLASAEQRATLGLYDDLTGLRNRRGLNDVLPTVLGPRVVLFVDVDNLRELNGLDDQNWEAGDQALAGVARLLQTLPPGTIVGRWGGDEFLVIVPGADTVAIVDELEALIRCACSELHFGDLEVTFSAGLAVARGPADQKDAQKAARGAAKTAKASGRARVVVADQEAWPEGRPGR
jgi:diguanylate cyclase (GGDEF)-like protein